MCVCICVCLSVYKLFILSIHPSSIYESIYLCLSILSSTYYLCIQFNSVQSLSRVQLFVTLWTAAHQACLSFTISLSLLKLMSIESVDSTISSSVVPFSSCLQSFQALGSFQTSQLFASGDQSVYLRLLILLLEILIPACASSSPTFCIMYSAYKLNKQGDNIQP